MLHFLLACSRRLCTWSGAKLRLNDVCLRKLCDFTLDSAHVIHDCFSVVRQIHAHDVSQQQLGRHPSSIYTAAAESIIA